MLMRSGQLLLELEALLGEEVHRPLDSEEPDQAAGMQTLYGMQTVSPRTVLRDIKAGAQEFKVVFQPACGVLPSPQAPPNSEVAQVKCWSPVDAFGVNQEEHWLRVYGCFSSHPGMFTC